MEMMRKSEQQPMTEPQQPSQSTSPETEPRPDDEKQTSSNQPPNLSNEPEKTSKAHQDTTIAPSNTSVSHQIGQPPAHAPCSVAQHSASPKPTSNTRHIVQGETHAQKYGSATSRLPLTLRARTAGSSKVPFTFTEPENLPRFHEYFASSYLEERPKLTEVAYNTSEWRFRNTVSFWVAVCFIEGSCLFLLGAIASAIPHLAKWKSDGLVTYGYFAGSLAYTGGAYLGWFEVINIGRTRRRLVACSGSSKAGFWGSVCYFIGALFYNVNCGVPLIIIDNEETERLVKIYFEGLSGVLGSLLFCFAAVIEWVHNADATPRQLVWWLCSSYFLGSVLFLVGAIGSMVEYTGIELSSVGAIDVPYAIGSSAFLFGAWIALCMWKTEAFGLGFIREINNLPPQAPMNRAISSLAAFDSAATVIEDGNSEALSSRTRLDRNDQIFLGIYVICAVLSILDICSLVAWHVDVKLGIERGVIFAEEVLTSFSVFFAVHVMLLLATVVHRTPTVEPYNYLLWLLRVGSIFFLVCSFLRWLKFYVSADYNELEFLINNIKELQENVTELTDYD